MFNVLMGCGLPWALISLALPSTVGTEKNMLKINNNNNVSEINPEIY